MRQYFKFFIFINLCWFFTGLYGLVFNQSFIDEAKYIIKGFLILSGQVSYYNTQNFFYQHLPGTLLWFGAGQIIFGPSLLIARIQSFAISLLLPIFAYKLGSWLDNKLTGLLAAMLLVLTPVLALNYATATPASLIALLLTLGILFFFQKKYYWASFIFALLLIVKENFFPTLLLYLFFLPLFFEKKIPEVLKNYFIVFITLAVFFLPGIEEIMDIAKRLPFLNLFISMPSTEKTIVSFNWQKDLHNPGLYLKAIVNFWSAYSLWLIVFLGIILQFFYKLPKIKINLKNKNVCFLGILVIANLTIHILAAKESSPKAIVSYFSYFAPLAATLLAFFITRLIKNLKITEKLFFYIFIFLFISYSLPSLRDLTILTSPFKTPDILKLPENAQQLQNLIPENEKVIWLAEPITLYLAGRKTYYPLLNHYNFYKDNPNTLLVENLGFWNQEMLTNWFKESSLVIIDPSKLELLQQSTSGRKLLLFIQNNLNNYTLINNFNGLLIYQKNNFLSFN